MPLTHIPGYLTGVTPARGNTQLISLCPMFPPMIDEKIIIDSKLWIVPHNKHSAAFVIDSLRYSMFLKNSPKVMPERYQMYSKGALSRVAVYIFGGIQKVVEVSAIKDGSAVVNHLPIKYANHLPHSVIKFIESKDIEKYS